MNVRALVSKISAALVLSAVVVTSTASAAGATWAIDPVHSSVIFRIQHANVGYTYGRFNEFSGSVVLDDANLAGSSVNVEIKVTSVDTNSKDRDAHLRSPDFFNIAQFPKITFVSKEVRKNGDAAFDVTGALTLHGVTKSVTVKMDKTGAGKDREGKDIVGFEGIVSIKRSDFDMKNMLQGIGDDVRLILAFECIKQ